MDEKKTKRKEVKGWLIYASFGRGSQKKILHQKVYLNKSVAEGENGYGPKALVPCTITFTLPKKKLSAH